MIVFSPQWFFIPTLERTHHYHHQYGFENAYDGSKANSPLADHGDVVDSERYIDVSDADHTQGTNVNKWGYQSDNRDAKYHYGHHVAEADLSTSENRPDSTQMGAGEAAFNGVVDDWRFSLRHAGCLYEAPDYYYGAKTFKAIRYRVVNFSLRLVKIWSANRNYKKRKSEYNNYQIFTYNVNFLPHLKQFLSTNRK